MRIYVGIDPGLRGAAGAIDQTGQFLDVIDLPHKDRYLDTIALFNWLYQYREHEVTVEEQHPRPGANINATSIMCVNYGRMQGILELNKFRWAEVAPVVWKRALGVTADKETSLALARELFPEAPLDLKKHDGRAEALLIAEYARRIHEQ